MGEVGQVGGARAFWRVLGMFFLEVSLLFRCFFGVLLERFWRFCMKAFWIFLKVREASRRSQRLAICCASQEAGSSFALACFTYLLRSSVQ